MATKEAVQQASRIAVPEPGTYGFDVAHSTIGAVARHLMVAKVRGSFTDFSGTVRIGETPEDSSVEVAIKAASITTGVDQRDEHLRSADFLNAAEFPELTFVSTRVRRTGETELEIDGDLTIRGVTKPVTLHASYEGLAKDPWGNVHAAFSATTELDREDWDMTWNQTLETGGVLVGKKLKIELDIQLVRQA